jgi:hypothetical protein
VILSRSVWRSAASGDRSRSDKWEQAEHPFNSEVFAQEEAKKKRRKLNRLQNMAESLNYRLVPIQ